MFIKHPVGRHICLRATFVWAIALCAAFFQAAAQGKSENTVSGTLRAPRI